MPNLSLDLQTLFKHQSSLSLPDDSKWHGICGSVNFPFLLKDLTPNFELLSTFRQKLYYINDIFPTNNNILNPRNFFPSHIHLMNELKRSFERLTNEFENCIFPVSLCNTPGSPFYRIIYNHAANLRWLRYIWFFNRIQLLLRPDFNSNFLFADFGGAYGAFSSIIKSYLPNSSHLIVDFPLQLSLARYYLGEMFPEATFFVPCSLSDFNQCNSSSFDFYLLTPAIYNALEQIKFKFSFFVATNFLSFGEMPRSDYTRYLVSLAWHSTKHIYSVNTISSRNTSNEIYDSDYSILEYLNLTSDYNLIFAKDFTLYDRFYSTSSVFTKFISKEHAYVELLSSLC